MLTLLREHERVVDEDVVLALLAGSDLGGVPGSVDLGCETRSPLVVPGSDGAVEDPHVRHERDSSRWQTRDVRFGLYLPNFNPTGDPRSVVELARRAEAAGWDGLFVWDDLIAEPPPVLDPWVMLGAVAAVTERLALGPMIVPLARRRPQKVALEAATLERLAPGRVILGVGMGSPRDFTSFGEDAAWRVRAGKIEAALAFMRSAWAGDVLGDDTEEQGRYTAEPLEIPVWVSGEWPRRREFHGVEFADGVFPIGRDESGSYAPLAPDVIRACRATLPDRATRSS
jgi:alkanesulfonate monooxygenase SsuD/methylene tetrahydromethanopterin reductase-like flavin-dependent oxidoreductase (luciferase family)